MACGLGRHTRWLASEGFQVTAVDRSAQAISAASPWAEAIKSDLENEPWPLADRQFDGIVVTNYLWRPLWPHLLGALAPGAVLIYETFSSAHASIGKPSRPEFLLRPAELLSLCAPLQVVAFEDGFMPSPERHVQRIAAVKPLVLATNNPPRHLLNVQPSDRSIARDGQQPS
jgi:hypothetical protein